MKNLEQLLTNYCLENSLIDSHKSFRIDENNILFPVRVKESILYTCGYIEWYKQRRVFHIRANHAFNSTVLHTLVTQRQSLIDSLYAYLDLHCKIANVSVVREYRGFLYAYKGAINLGIEIKFHIDDWTVPLYIFENKVELAKKQIRKFFKKYYFSKVADKSYYHMTREEKALVCMIHC